jgi:glyoxylase I family protein
MTRPTYPAAGAWAEVRGVSHVALDVADLERSIAFYITALGLEIFHDDRANRDRPSIKGLVGDFAIELEQNIVEPGRPAPHVGSAAASGAQKVSFTVADVEAAFAYFSAAGFAVSDAILETRRVKMFFAKDPDGYVFELIEFPPGIRALGDLVPIFRSAAGKSA